MRIEKAMDITLTILVDHSGYRIRYDKLSFLFRQKLPSADPKMFEQVMASLEEAKCIAFGKSKQDLDKVYLTSSGVQLYINGGVYQSLLFGKIRIIFFILLLLTIGMIGYFLF
jgi:hypothetical protein